MNGYRLPTANAAWHRMRSLRSVQDQRGANMMEYIVIAFLVGAILITGFWQFGKQLELYFDEGQAGTGTINQLYHLEEVFEED